MEPTNKQKVSRKEFLAYSGAGLLSLIGIGSIIKLLNGEQLPKDNDQGYQLKSAKNKPNGYAGLNSSGKVPLALLPANTASVASVFGRTGAITAQTGDYNAAQVTDALQASNNLSDVDSVSTSRTNLGLGTAATQNKVAAGTHGVLNATDPTTTNSRTPDGTAGGDLSGTYPDPTVAGVNGVSVSGTPATGQVLTATSTSAANWQSGISGQVAWESVAVPTDAEGWGFTAPVPAAIVAAESLTLPLTITTGNNQFVLNNPNLEPPSDSPFIVSSGTYTTIDEVAAAMQAALSLGGEETNYFAGQSLQDAGFDVVVQSGVLVLSDPVGVLNTWGLAAGYFSDVLVDLGFTGSVAGVGGPQLADNNANIPLTVVANVNDSFNLQFSGEWVVAPGVYTTLVELVAAVNAATNSAFSGKSLYESGGLTATVSGSKILLTLYTWNGSWGFPEITSGTHDILASLGFNSGDVGGNGTAPTYLLSSGGNPNNGPWIFNDDGSITMESEAGGMLLAPANVYGHYWAVQLDVYLSSDATQMRVWFTAANDPVYSPETLNADNPEGFGFYVDGANVGYSIVQQTEIMFPGNEYIESGQIDEPPNVEIETWYTLQAIATPNGAFFFIDGVLACWGAYYPEGYRQLFYSQFGLGIPNGGTTVRNLKAWRIPVPVLT